jgi:protein disulfide-isomerase A6
MTKKEQENFLEGIILAGKYDVGAFPNLNLFPKNYKDGEEFYGGCDLDEFDVFINEKVGSMDDLVK